MMRHAIRRKEDLVIRIQIAMNAKGKTLEEVRLATARHHRKTIAQLENELGQLTWGGK